MVSKNSYDSTKIHMILFFFFRCLFLPEIVDISTFHLMPALL